MAKRLEQLNTAELLNMIRVIATGNPDDIDFSEITHDQLGAMGEFSFGGSEPVFFGWPQDILYGLLYIDSPTARQKILLWLCELLFEGAYEADWKERAELTCEEFAACEELSIWEILHREVLQLLYELVHEEGDEEEWLTSGCEWKRVLTERFSNLCL